MEFDFLSPLKVLVEFGVRFVVIGGVAGRLHGSVTITKDLDICYARDDENLERLAGALGSLGATLRGAPGDVPFILDAGTLKRGNAFTFDTDMGSIDILGEPVIGVGYDILFANSVEADLDGITIRYAAIDDLIRMKRAGGRLKDLLAVENLGALRDELEKRGEL